MVEVLGGVAAATHSTVGGRSVVLAEQAVIYSQVVLLYKERASTQMSGSRVGISKRILVKALQCSAQQESCYS